jgi:Domain of unknown function (DUF4232)
VTAALTASLGAGSGAAGSSYYPIEFTNSSGSSCSMYGYPGISFVTAAGSQIGTPATEDPTYARQLVTLAPGGTAHAELRVVNAQNYPASTCRPVTAHRLKVYPPGQTGALYISFTATACSNPSVQILAVQTVQPGKGGARYPSRPPWPARSLTRHGSGRRTAASVMPFSCVDDAASSAAAAWSARVTATRRASRGGTRSGTVCSMNRP